MAVNKKSKKQQVVDVEEQLPEITIEEAPVAELEGGQLPEVKEEVKAPKVSTPKVAKGSDADIVTSIIESSGTAVEKFEKICESNTVYSALAKNLKSYQEKMGNKAPVPTNIDGAGYNYNLYVWLLAVINTELYSEFKIKFDIINLCFQAYANDAYSEFKLFRFSLDWKFGKDKYNTYQKLAILICILCDKTKRKEELKKISPNKALTLDGTKFTELAIQNVKRYYEL